MATEGTRVIVDEEAVPLAAAVRAFADEAVICPIAVT